MITLQQQLNEEIEDCIDSVSKLSPLVPWYLDYTSAEIGAASLVIAIKHSLKTLKTEAKGDNNDLDILKELYNKWTQSIFTSYNIDIEKILQFTVYLKEFLAKVWD